MKKLLFLPLLALAGLANAGFTLTAGTSDPFAFQWFEPSWDTGMNPGFGNGAYNPGTGLVVNKDTVYQTGFWYRANRIGVQDMTRELQVTRFTSITHPTSDMGFAEAYETSPASGMNSGIVFTFDTKLVAVSATQSYVRINWTARNLVTEPGANYEVNLFPYADLQTNPFSPNSDKLSFNAATRTYTYNNSGSGFPSVTFRALTPEISSWGAGLYTQFRSGLSDNNVTYSLGSANPNPNTVQDWATAFQTTFTLEPGGTKTGSVAIGYNMTPPNNVAVTGNVSLGDWTASTANRPVQIEFRDPNSDALVESGTVYLNANGEYSYATTLQGQYRIYAKSSHWLRKNLGLFTVAAGGLAGVDAALTNGDIDNDNVVSVFDYIRLSEKFDLDSGSLFFDPECDLDGDGVISVFDYIILSQNFDLQGD